MGALSKHMAPELVTVRAETVFLKSVWCVIDVLVMGYGQTL